jgi:N-acetylmuramoyl-L-alanine amidase
VAVNGKWSDVRLSIGERPPFLVAQSRDAITLTLYGTSANTDLINLATEDPTVRDVTWETVANDRVRYTVHLRHPSAGYGVLWDRGGLLLKVRHAPTIDPLRPLAGRTIVVDPGHPPIGSTGPTGLYEGDVTLAVGEKLKALLEERGATVVMTRTTRAAVALGARPGIARRTDGDAFVSIHLNAWPDGANPARAANGTGTYFFHDQSEGLARVVQQGLVRRMGLRDLGINYDNLAVARLTWMPAVLCEGAFVIVPQQEAALRTPEFQRQYALGIADGLEEYFRRQRDDR